MNSPNLSPDFPPPPSGPRTAHAPTAGPAQPSTAPIDPLLAARLQRLSEQKAANRRTTPAATTTSRTSPTGGRRAKPARSAKMAAAALSIATTAGLATLFAGNHAGASQIAVATTPVTSPATSSSVAVAANGTGTVAISPTASTATAIADGTYVGSGSNNRFGTVQVEVVYSGGAITDVHVLQSPDADRKSVAINTSALPTLVSQAITAQSANVDGVSGATYTSRSYVASLQSAIDNAKANSGVVS